MEKPTTPDPVAPAYIVGKYKMDHSIIVDIVSPMTGKLLAEFLNDVATVSVVSTVHGRYHAIVLRNYDLDAVATSIYEYGVWLDAQPTAEQSE